MSVNKHHAKQDQPTHNPTATEKQPPRGSKEAIMQHLRRANSYASGQAAVSVGNYSCAPQARTQYQEGPEPTIRMSQSDREVGLSLGNSATFQVDVLGGPAPGDACFTYTPVVLNAAGKTGQDADACVSVNPAAGVSTNDKSQAFTVTGKAEGRVGFRADLHYSTDQYGHGGVVTGPTVPVVVNPFPLKKAKPISGGKVVHIGAEAVKQRVQAMLDLKIAALPVKEFFPALDGLGPVTPNRLAGDLEEEAKMGAERRAFGTRVQNRNHRTMEPLPGFHREAKGIGSRQWEQAVSMRVLGAVIHHYNVKLQSRHEDIVRMLERGRVGMVANAIYVDLTRDLIADVQAIAPMLARHYDPSATATPTLDVWKVDHPPEVAAYFKSKEGR